LHQNVKGISVAGINDDGSALNILNQSLSSCADTTYTITHSAGINVPVNSGITTEKLIAISPQIRRGDLENWIDTMGMSSDKVLIVDIKGDLPFRPTDVIGLGPTDILNPTNLINPNPANIVSAGLNYAAIENAYYDYSQNPNNKYTYIRIEDGPDIGYNPMTNHRIGVDNAINGSTKLYQFSINGTMYPTRKTLKEIYEMFLRGEI